MNDALDRLVAMAYADDLKVSPGTHAGLQRIIDLVKNHSKMPALDVTTKSHDDIQP
jgi:hypothetical protein